MLLLNPGPVTLSERVRGSLTRPDLCHREGEYFDLQDEIRTGLLAVHALDVGVWSAVLMTASGTGAVESMVTALVPPEGRLLIVDNGVYGERMVQICARYAIAHDRMNGNWMNSPDLRSVAARLDGAPTAARFTHVGVVHHETTTGRLNDLSALYELCRTRSAEVLVDAVSSFGAEEIAFSDPLTAVAASANKCLHGAPGASFVIVRRDALERAVSRTFYLDLGRLALLQDRRDTPFTPAVHVYFALREALREFAEQGGRAARHVRYLGLAEQVRTGLGAMGIDPLLNPTESSVVLRAYRLPQQASYAVLHDALKSDGFVIYAGQGGLSEAIFRISTMGCVMPSDIDRLLHSMSRLLR